MKIKGKTYYFLVLAVTVVGAALWVAIMDGGPRAVRFASDGEVLRIAVLPSVAKNGRSSQSIPPPKVLRERQIGKTAETMESAETDDKLLDAVMKELLTELSVARKSGKMPEMLALINKIRSLNYGLRDGSPSSRGIARLVKRKVLECLDGVGLAGLEAVLDLVGDPEPDVSATAKNEVFDSLLDLSLGDAERAEIVVAAAAEMTDSTSLNRLYHEFTRMRPTVGKGALLQIGATGTPEAREILPRVIGAFTGDVTVKTAEQLRAWEALDPEDTRPYDPILPKTAANR